MNKDNFCRTLWMLVLSVLLPLSSHLTFGQQPQQSALPPSLQQLKSVLEEAPVQEKIYLHLDNMCYFKGDTIWYKAYVVRADSLTYTDMSRLLYVELVSPDGMLVERQTLVASAEGHGFGNFQLPDSIYSGYYELRAYTRWMLNFCVTEHDNNRTDREQFYNVQMAHDFFRQYGTIYSRVFPVYERPDSTGDYSMKYIVSRPKQRLDKELKPRLTVNFYPEGGHLIAGTKANIAFEAYDEEGQQVDFEGHIGNTPVKTLHQGRGLITLNVPTTTSSLPPLTVNFEDKNYSFDLPKVERDGCGLQLTNDETTLTLNVQLRRLLPELDYAAIVLCRGSLKLFEPLMFDSDGNARLTIEKKQLPTGVNDLLIVDAEGRPLADRLFFVNNHDYGQQFISISANATDYQPLEKITLNVKAPQQTQHISVSVRDAASDEPTYDTGNIMTDLLLSSELKGFVAHPDYYFEADDALHRQHLDLLMMVQGWRRYDYSEIISKEPLRYEPEQGITVEGTVYKTVPIEDVEPDEIRYWQSGVFGYSPRKAEHLDPEDPTYKKLMQRVNGDNEEQSTTNGDGTIQMEEVGPTIYLAETNTPVSAIDPHFGVNHSGLNYEVTVEGELVKGTQVAAATMETTGGGHFKFNVPPFFDNAILFLRAYDTDASDRKKNRLAHKGVLDEEEWPEYYVKRDLFYPIFAKKYSYYQCHLPENEDDDSQSLALDTQFATDTERLSSMDRQLQNVEVKKRRRRGRRPIDYSKPACVYDTYELYNLATDYGLSFGKFNMSRFPAQLSMVLLGNYNRERFFNIMGRINSDQGRPYVFYRNYAPDFAVVDTTPMQSDNAMYDAIKLARQDEVRLFTDFELRNEDKAIEMQQTTADVTLDFVTLADEGRRYTYRDRRIMVKGVYEPDGFYYRDYSQPPSLSDVKDYRRTLFWCPVAPLDNDGSVIITLYNNAKPSRIRVSAVGITTDGQPVYNKP